jgi:hypothetical protein
MQASDCVVERSIRPTCSGISADPSAAEFGAERTDAFMAVRELTARLASA